MKENMRNVSIVNIQNLKKLEDSMQGQLEETYDKMRSM